MATVSALNIIITATATGATAALGATSKALSGLSAAAGKATSQTGMMSKITSTHMLVAGAAVGGFAIAAVNAASTVGEAQNKVMVVFGDSAQSVLDFSTTTASAMGISQGAALEAAGGFGAMLQTAGLAEGASASMSTSLVQLAADMASFNNVDPSVMLEKLRAGLAGEAEPLRTTGVFLSEAAVQAEAFSSGIAETGSTLTEAQKVQARYNLILEQTAKQQGDFANTVGTSVPNQLRVMSATFTNIMATIGAAIIPVIQIVLSIVGPIAMVVGEVLKFASAVGILTPVLAVLGAAVLAFAVAWVVYTVAQSAAAAAAGDFMLSIAPFIGIALAIGAAIGLMAKLVMTALSALSGGWAKMSGAAKIALVILAPLWIPIVAAIKITQALLGVIGKAFSAAFSGAGQVISFVAARLGETISWLGKAGAAVKAWAGDWIQLVPVVGQVVKAIELINIVQDIAKADAMAVSAEMRTVGLTTVLAAQQGSAAIVQMGQNLAVVRQHMQETGQSAQWTQQFQAGLTAVDNALKAGTLSAADAEKAYMAWGMSLQAAQQRAASTTGAVKALDSATKPAVDAAGAMSSAWEKVGPKAAGSINKISQAINKSINSAVKMARNTQIVTDRLVNDYGLTAEGAEQFLAGASSKAMQTMAKKGGKAFSDIGSKAQKFNKFLPESEKGTGQLSAAAAKFAQSGDKMGRSLEGNAKALNNGAKGANKFGQDVEKGTKAAGSGAKDVDKLNKALGQTEKEAGGAVNTVNKLGGSLKSNAGSVQTMATNVGKLKTELAGLKSVTITVTVNIKKTGELGLGGVVPGLARGGTSMMPLTKVGEWGQELAALPVGTRVYSHAETMGISAAMRQDAAGAGGTGQMTLKGKLTLVGGDAYIEGVVQEVLNDGMSLDSALTKAIRRP